MFRNLLTVLFLLLPFPSMGADVGVNDDFDEEEQVLLAQAGLPDAGAASPDSAAPSVLVIPGVVVPPVEQDDPFERGREAYEALQMARRAPTVGAVAACVAAAIMLLIALARRFGGMLLEPDQVAKFVLFASALAGGVAKISDGMHWLEIATITVMPILAVGFHQTLVKPITRARSSRKKKA